MKNNYNVNKCINEVVEIFNKFDIDYTIDTLEAIINRSIQAKMGLYMRFKDIPTWDEETNTFYIDVMHAPEPNFSTVRSIYRSILTEIDLYNNCDISHDLRMLSYVISNSITGEVLATKIKNLTGLNTSQYKKTSKALSELISWVMEKYYKDDTNIKTINILLADLGDSLKSKPITQRVYFSIGFYDFITMSNGNSWDSCHWMDGCHRAGTISYATDNVTIIAYTENAQRKKIWRRCLILSEDALIASRIYGDNNLELMDEVTKQFLKKLNIDFTETSNDYIKRYFINFTDGCQYPDYHFTYSDVQLFTREGEAFPNDRVYIGNYSYCTVTGNINYNADALSTTQLHVWCYQCNEHILMDDAIEINGQYYCIEHTEKCTECDEFHLQEDMYYIESTNEWVCDDCFSNDYTVCEYCGEYVKEEDATRVRNNDYNSGWAYYCSNCVD